MSLPGVATTFAAERQADRADVRRVQGRLRRRLLFDTLERNAVPAVLFFCARVDRRQTPAAPRNSPQTRCSTIGNHGTRHVPLSVTGRSAYGIGGTRSVDEVVAEVWTNHEKIAALTGKAPTWFRPGTAHYDDVAVGIVRELGRNVRSASR